MDDSIDCDDAFFVVYIHIPTYSFFFSSMIIHNI